MKDQSSNRDRLFNRLPVAAIDAHLAAEALMQQGVPCYVRCWHLGQTGWFVVHAETYERLNFSTHVEAMVYSSLRNRRLVEQGQRQDLDCGCYFCGHTFAARDVVSFTSDQTARCPNCECDSVLVGVTQPEALFAGLERWFTGTPTASPREPA